MRSSTFSFSVDGEPRVLTERVRAIGSIFGLDPLQQRREIIKAAEVPLNGITYITGFSGSGKSTLLHLIEEAKPKAMSLPRVPEENCAIVDLFGASLGNTIYWLSKFGLGEAHVLRSRARDLSEGQKYRLCLALLLAQKPQVVVVDEFLSLLDRTTAKMVAYNFQKICREQGITLYAATAHEDLMQSLTPDYVIKMELDGSSETKSYETDDDPRTFLERQNFTAENGTLEDYKKLAHYHYRTTTEDALDWDGLVRQIRIVKHEGRVAAIRVFTRPFSQELEKAPFFKTLNERVLVSERVVIHPAYRGIGLTSLLEPTCTMGFRFIFAQSALGLYYPFHLKSGFEKIEHPNNILTEVQDELQKMVGAHMVEAETNLHSSVALQTLVESVGESTKKTLQFCAQKAFVDKNVVFTLFLAELAGLICGEKERSQLRLFFERIVQILPESHLGHIIEISLPYPMQAFVKYLDKTSELL